MSWLDVESIAGALIYLSAGLLIIPFVYGRFLAHIRESRGRSIAVRCMLVACTALCLLLGYWRAVDYWLIVPGLVWLCAVILELERLVMQRRHRSAPPVEEDVPGFSLLKPFTTTALAVRRYELCVPEWSRGRMRIAHISDLHVHGTLEPGYFHGVTERIKAMAPDAVFITGDFISRTKYARVLPEALKGLDAPLGVYACLGNHDFWSNADEVRGALGKTSVQLLDARGTVLDACGDKLLVSACEDPWGDQAWAVPERAEGVPLAVLSHTADNIYDLSDADADIVFTGHYHAGQGALPWYGPVVIPSRHGRRFDHGHFLVNKTHLYVTAGIGVAFPPFRVYCHPEILVVDLAAGKL